VPEQTHVELVRPLELFEGAPYAYASVAHEVSRLVFAAGACPLDAQGLIVGKGDIPGQAAQCIENLVTALESAGATLSDIVKTTVFVASSDRQDLLAAWDVVEKAFADHPAPSTLLGVACLGYRDQLVEIEATAAIR
jgi:enamine deaminase RidA (YjgF/YER057c/UK114 family)